MSKYNFFDLTANTVGKYVNVKIISTIVIFLLSFSCLAAGLICALIRELLGVPDPIDGKSKALEAISVTLCYISVCPLAVLPYLFSDAGSAIGAFLRVEFCGFSFRRVVYFGVAIFTTGLGLFVFFFTFSLHTFYYSTFSGNSQEAYHQVASIITGIGFFLCVQGFIDFFVGYGKLRNYVVHASNISGELKKLSFYERQLYYQMLTFFSRNEKTMYSTKYLLDYFAYSHEEEGKVLLQDQEHHNSHPTHENKHHHHHHDNIEEDELTDLMLTEVLLLRLLRLIPHMKYREHERRGIRIYGVIDLSTSHRHSRAKPTGTLSVTASFNKDVVIVDTNAKKRNSSANLKK